MCSCVPVLGHFLLSIYHILQDKCGDHWLFDTIKPFASVSLYNMQDRTIWLPSHR